MNLLSHTENLHISGGATSGIMQELNYKLSGYTRFIGEAVIAGAMIGVSASLPAAIASSSFAPIVKGSFYGSAIGAAIPLHLAANHIFATVVEITLDCIFP